MATKRWNQLKKETLTSPEESGYTRYLSTYERPEKVAWMFHLKWILNFKLPSHQVSSYRHRQDRPPLNKQITIINLQEPFKSFSMSKGLNRKLLRTQCVQIKYDHKISVIAIETRPRFSSNYIISQSSISLWGSYDEINIKSVSPRLKNAQQVLILISLWHSSKGYSNWEKYVSFSLISCLICYIWDLMYFSYISGGKLYTQHICNLKAQTCFAS